MNSIGKFRQLSASERRMLFSALWMLPLMGCSLRLAGFRWCQSILIRLASWFEGRIPGPLGHDLAEARAAARMVKIASQRGLFRTRCLQKSLVLWWLMQERGIRGDVWFGVRKDGAGLDAHAWVEYAGVVLNDQDDVHERFAAFKALNIMRRNAITSCSHTCTELDPD